MVVTTESLKTRPFGNVALELLLFGVTVSLGVALVKALHSSIGAMIGDSFEGLSSAWMVFLLVLMISIIYVMSLKQILQNCCSEDEENETDE